MMTDTTALDAFLARVRRASLAQSKDVRLTLAEAVELGACIGQVLARLVMQEARASAAPFEVSRPTRMDGGGF